MPSLREAVRSSIGKKHPNASASLFAGAKVSQYELTPQGRVEAGHRVMRMVERMDAEGFGSCSNHAECVAVCPFER